MQIPCYNEEKTLPLAVKEIPRRIDGVDEVEILIIDDGSTDGTAAVAREIGVDHIVKNTRNQGLAMTFQTGMLACLNLGADIIVNTDGDAQYRGDAIPALIAPILAGNADMVIGDRQTDTIAYFSPSKKMFQKFGSFMVRRFSGAGTPDAVSGFRAFNRRAALQMNVISSFSYTIETIIQANKKKLAIDSVPIGVNPKTRESRLFQSVPKFIVQSAQTMIRVYTMYSPMRMFFFIGGFLIFSGLIPSIRFLIYYFNGQGDGHVQSLILAAILFIVGFNVLMIGLLADVISFNRKLTEEVLLRLRRMDLAKSTKSDEK